MQQQMMLIQQQQQMLNMGIPVTNSQIPPSPSIPNIS
jgi:hypothetical protein